MILDSALQIFVSKGYSDARMDDIVDLSGMSKGAIYYHYKSKKDLFLALIDHWELHTFPNFYDKNKNGIPASEILRSFADAVADAVDGHVAFVGMGSALELVVVVAAAAVCCWTGWHHHHMELKHTDSDVT